MEPLPAHPSHWAAHCASTGILIPSQHDPSTGKTKGPTPKSRTLSDLHVYLISDVVIRQPLHIEPELAHTSDPV